MSDILFEKFKNDFRVGAALNGFIYDDQAVAKFEKRIGKKLPFDVKDIKDGEIVKNHFNLIVAENDTKMERIYKAENTFDFETADKFVKWGKENNKDIRWHTLVWHNQSPKWIFEDGNGGKATKEQLEKRTRDYIYAVGQRYANDICSVDVVNECISDKKFALRTPEDRSQWLDIMGPDYVDKAFYWAKEAFPKSNLVINDYNLEMIPGKRNGMYEFVKGMLSRGVPVDTVGLQMHINMAYPPVSMIEETIELYGSLGLNVIVTEMDVSVYYDFKDGKEEFEQRKEFTAELMEKQAARYAELFQCFRKEAQKGILKDVVLWGITDAFSWKNHFPVPGRMDAPLLFGVKGEPKPAFESVMKI
ncbi:endo-1,4-beta-xylanase [Treponema sp.]|uniref:endo-1,4-beta-xylanase n=1 Tax=Treponema sp. TaxID=166 RepID=UPI00298DF4F0|nr:endo-1,4-beta-xylanase [Treponema sp.]MCQ2241662.1 endo-1,4-beta-xylanase [Treponema sp.]